MFLYGESTREERAPHRAGPDGADGARFVTCITLLVCTMGGNSPDRSGEVHLGALALWGDAGHTVSCDQSALVSSGWPLSHSKEGVPYAGTTYRRATIGAPFPFPA